MKILFKISIVLSLFSALLFTSGFSTSNDSVQFIKTNWVENSEGVIIVNSDINRFDEDTFTNFGDEVIIRKRYELEFKFKCGLSKKWLAE